MGERESQSQKYHLVVSLRFPCREEDPTVVKEVLRLLRRYMEQNKTKQKIKLFVHVCKRVLLLRVLNVVVNLYYAYKLGCV